MLSGHSPWLSDSLSDGRRPRLPNHGACTPKRHPLAGTFGLFSTGAPIPGLPVFVWSTVASRANGEPQPSTVYRFATHQYQTDPANAISPIAIATAKAAR